MRIQEQQSGLSIQRFSAVDAATLDIMSMPEVSVSVKHDILNNERKDHRDINSKGAIGASFSHIELWKQLIASDKNVYLILEDDCTLSADAKATIEAALAHVEELGNWDILLLNSSNYILTSQPISDTLHTVQRFIGMHSYFITKKGAKALLENALPIDMHIDAYIGYMAELGKITIYWDITPKITQVEQDRSYSDIAHSTHLLTLFPRSEKKQILLFSSILIAAIAIGYFAGYLRRRT